MAIHLYSLTASYNCGGQFCQNVLHYQFDDAGFTDTAAAALSLINAFDAANTAKLKLILPTVTQILSYRARGITMPGGFEAIKLLGAQFGARTGALQVAAVSPVMVLFPTGNAKPRGRVFLPGVTNTDLVDGEFTNTFRGVITTNQVMFINTINLVGGGSPVATPVIASRKTTPPSAYAIEYAMLSDLPGTQRRRQRPA